MNDITIDFLIFWKFCKYEKYIKKMDEEVRIGGGGGGGTRVEMVGFTVVVVAGKEKVMVANC